MEIQKAGDNSQQIQIHNLIVNGIDEKRAREIYAERYDIAKRDFANEALRVVNERVRELENRLMPKIMSIHNGLNAFADPSFQFLLLDAQKAAAASERLADYDLLSELLAHRVEKGEDRVVRTGIRRAVQIVDEISDAALLGLTVVHSVNSLMPIALNLDQALDILDDLFGKIIYAELPNGTNWIDQLDMLDAIRINQFGKFRTIKEYYTSNFKNFLELGIKKGSEEFLQAEKILIQQGLSGLMVEHSLISEYSRINANGIEGLDDLIIVQVINGERKKISLTVEQKMAIKPIFELYSKDDKLQKQIYDSFLTAWDRRPNLLKLRNWWETLPYSFTVTTVGKVLAHANAQRQSPNVPPLS